MPIVDWTSLCPPLVRGEVGPSLALRVRIHIAAVHQDAPYKLEFRFLTGAARKEHSDAVHQDARYEEVRRWFWS